MRYKIDSILELSQHLYSLNAEEKTAMISFLHLNAGPSMNEDVFLQLESMSSDLINK